MYGFGRYPDPKERLDLVVEMMREISLEEDPHRLVEIYGRRMAMFLRSDAFVSVSRRGHSYPEFRVTRSSRQPTNMDPWRNMHQLPRLSGGLVAELLYSDRPHVVSPVKLSPSDPIAPYLDPEVELLVAIPHYDKGKSLNMVLHAYRDGSEFSMDDLPELVWMSNLFGRGVNNLALSRSLREAYEALERELKVVARLQQTLLPQTVPSISTMDLAIHYQTSRNAGGDYYDFFDLGLGEDGSRQWGIFVADVSGHGTPAAVVMAVAHALAHAYPGRPKPPALLLHYLNQKLCDSPASSSGTFVTATYAIYDERSRRLRVASAGHPAARLLRLGRRGEVLPQGEVASPRSLPLGISAEETFHEAVTELMPGDRLAWYTDGITESFGAGGEMFGTGRLDEALAVPVGDPQEMINSVIERLGEFTGQPRGEDDRTLIAAVVR